MKIFVRSIPKRRRTASEQPRGKRRQSSALGLAWTYGQHAPSQAQRPPSACLSFRSSASGSGSRSRAAARAPADRPHSSEMPLGVSHTLRGRGEKGRRRKARSRTELVFILAQNKNLDKKEQASDWSYAVAFSLYRCVQIAFGKALQKYSRIFFLTAGKLWRAEAAVFQLLRTLGTLKLRGLPRRRQSEARPGRARGSAPACLSRCPARPGPRPRGGSLTARSRWRGPCSGTPRCTGSAGRSPPATRAQERAVTARLTTAASRYRPPPRPRPRPRRAGPALPQPSREGPCRHGHGRAHLLQRLLVHLRLPAQPLRHERHRHTAAAAAPRAKAEGKRRPAPPTPPPPQAPIGSQGPLAHAPPPWRAAARLGTSVAECGGEGEGEGERKGRGRGEGSARSAPVPQDAGVFPTQNTSPGGRENLSRPVPHPPADGSRRRDGGGPPPPLGQERDRTADTSPPPLRNNLRERGFIEQFILV